MSWTNWNALWSPVANWSLAMFTSSVSGIAMPSTTLRVLGCVVGQRAERLRVTDQLRELVAHVAGSLEAVDTGGE